MVPVTCGRLAPVGMSAAIALAWPFATSRTPQLRPDSYDSSPAGIRDPRLHESLFYRGVGDNASWACACTPGRN